MIQNPKFHHKGCKAKGLCGFDSMSSFVIFEIKLKGQERKTGRFEFNSNKIQGSFPLFG